jgi:predicted NBD/HSP70 family sugar kinase
MAVGLVTREGAVLATEVAPTHGPEPATTERTLTTLIERVLVRAKHDALRVSAIGVGVPGIVDPATGIVGEAHHVADLSGRDLARALQARFGHPTFVDNDVNTLALSESMFGEGRGARSLVVLAAGTGIGAGIVLDGRLVRGATGYAGEFGHVTVRVDGPDCWCGARGCLVVYASGRGIAEAAGGRPAPRVFAAAAAGDGRAAAIVERACAALGAMLGTIVNSLNPQTIVVTGGVAGAYAARQPLVLQSTARHVLAPALAGTRIVFVPGDKRATVRGPAALAFYEAGDRAS